MKRRWLLALAGVLVTSCSARDRPADQPASVGVPARTMAEGRRWMVANLSVTTPGSYCYDDAQGYCQRYGRLYTWASALEGCRSLGRGWRLPTDQEWRNLAQRHGGISEDSGEGGKTAYSRLMLGGDAQFDALLAGNRAPSGAYERRDAHGFYWTATGTEAGTAVFYNFGRGSRALYRQPEGDTRMAASVRCITD